MSARAVLLVLALVAPGPELVAVYPNPVAPEDRGERVVLSVPPGTDLGGLALTDGESTARFPNRTAGDLIVASTAPAAARKLTDAPVVALSGRLDLANGGETVRLKRGNRTLGTVTYGDAPEAEGYHRSADGWVWRPLGATDRPVVRLRDVPGTAFVLPDSPEVVFETLRGARRRILLAGYTLTSARVVDALCAASGRGVRVRVLVEGTPVGGLTRRGADALDRLRACGVAVAAIGGPYDRYAVHHAKYAVVDDRALVVTENWKPSGVGGHSSRGWGIRVDDPEAADALAATFLTDAGFRDAIPWGRFRGKRSPRSGDPPADAAYPERFGPVSGRLDRVTVAVAPDNAAGVLRREIAAAEDSILVEQMAIGGRRTPLLRATLRAARRGVRVRILLSSAWYVREENRALADWLSGRADAEGLDLRVRLADPRSRFEKIHAKGVVIDGDTAVVGSLNWNNASLRENRETVLVVEGEPARLYARVFRADWEGGRSRLPAGAPAVALVVVVLAWLAGRRIRFEG